MSGQVLVPISTSSRPILSRNRSSFRQQGSWTFQIWRKIIASHTVVTLHWHQMWPERWPWHIQLLIQLSLQHQACVVWLQHNLSRCIINSQEFITNDFTTLHLLVHGLHLVSPLQSHRGRSFHLNTWWVLLQKLFSSGAWNEGHVRVLRPSYEFEQDANIYHLMLPCGTGIKRNQMGNTGSRRTSIILDSPGFG